MTKFVGPFIFVTLGLLELIDFYRNTYLFPSSVSTDNVKPIQIRDELNRKICDDDELKDNSRNDDELSIDDQIVAYSMGTNTSLFENESSSSNCNESEICNKNIVQSNKTISYISSPEAWAIAFGVCCTNVVGRLTVQNTYIMMTVTFGCSLLLVYVGHLICSYMWSSVSHKYVKALSGIGLICIGISSAFS